MITNVLRAALAGAVLIAPGTATAAHAHTPTHETDWQRVGDDITSGISGIAVDGVHGGTADLLAVRDNKKPGENRLVALRHRAGAQPSQRPVAWAGEPAVDLEAIDAVPGRPHEYVALASGGTAYRIHWEGDTARVLAAFPVPGVSPDDNYEGFALTASRDGKVIAVWADRGQDDRPATLSAAPWDPRGNTFGEPVSAEFRVPYPAHDVRHISDVEVSATGRVTVSSASDPGDDGPYDSALFDAGRVTASGHGGLVRLTVHRSPHRVATFPGHKIEALACLPHSREGVVGTDDENDGGSVTATDVCRP
ncbi:hypothetical protein [Streptomyces sp. CB03238]|uniref:hypothetical protein n=1 Tax=Streptomyces sp. CB03238 TaxID=1907777 RepID=UPI000A0F9E14|nr:hypothetical protein [Streptomyces sp. CB03238]ORT61365.1 hypothetical protein BKD26_04670 [Streptomyces sp. CB03238]